MLGNLFKPLSNSSKSISPVYRVYLTEEVERDGYLVTDTVLRTVDVADSLKQFDYRDFSIGNLVAVGAYRPQPAVMVHNSDLGVVDHVTTLPLPPQNNEQK